MSLRPEIWGGIECTINRVGNVFHDQLELSAHYACGSDDVSRFASLGINAIRYPILWEKHELRECQTIDWTWTEKQLTHLRQSGIQVIAGLLHHGSGPMHTNLLDPLFPERFYEYALRVARRFPWIECYTPINEPLTTARFSGLYGFWFPHHKTDTSFVRMLLNQVRAIILAMFAIRSVNPRAKLIQTEDLSKTHSTDQLAYQAAFENQRRWLTIDLLCGRVDSKHHLWKYLLASGATENELHFFIENPCPPDIIGWNYYVTSERFLDEDTTRFPSAAVGGNGVHQYVDVEAVRANRQSGLKQLLLEAHEEFGMPMAITEAHICCTREEQMRWLMEIWNCCCELNEEGCDMVAVTAWALLGSFNWASLLTRQSNEYESGVFDIGGGDRRPTVLAEVIRSLALNGEYVHPLLDHTGWWNRNDQSIQSTQISGQHSRRQLLIVGNRDRFPFRRICEERSVSIQFADHADAISMDGSFETMLRASHPWAVVYVTSEQETEVDSLVSIADCCSAYGTRLMIVCIGNSLCDERAEDLSTAFVMKAALPECDDPAYQERLVQLSLDLMIDDVKGVWKMVGERMAEYVGITEIETSLING